MEGVLSNINETLSDVVRALDEQGTSLADIPSLYEILKDIRDAMQVKREPVLDLDRFFDAIKPYGRIRGGGGLRLVCDPTIDDDEPDFVLQSHRGTKWTVGPNLFVAPTQYELLKKVDPAVLERKVGEWPGIDCGNDCYITSVVIKGDQLKLITYNQKDDCLVASQGDEDACTPGNTNLCAKGRICPAHAKNANIHRENNNERCMLCGTCHCTLDASEDGCDWYRCNKINKKQKIGE